jgi:hypothetical protein
MTLSSDRLERWFREFGAEIRVVPLDYAVFDKLEDMAEELRSKCCFVHPD